MKSLKLTDEQYEMLKNLCHERKTQDNRCTASPIWAVQTQRYRVCDPEYSNGETALVILTEDYDPLAKSDDFQELKSEFSEYLEEYYEDGEIDEDEWDEFNQLDDLWGLENFIDDLDRKHNLKFHIHTIEYYYEDEAWFLTDVEAKEYLKYQSHNLTNPRTYVYHTGYSNCGYLPKLLDMFLKLEFED